MLHHYLKSYSETSGAHYSVGSSDKFILIQLQDDTGEQVRVRLDEEEAEHLISLLKKELYEFDN